VGNTESGLPVAFVLLVDSSNVSIMQTRSLHELGPHAAAVDVFDLLESADFVVVLQQKGQCQ